MPRQIKCSGKKKRRGYEEILKIPRQVGVNKGKAA
jgi:hypothetical protein